MTKAQPKLEVVADQKGQGGPLEMLSELAGEIAGMANSLKRLADRVEDVALAVEHEREGNAEAVGKLKQLQELLKGISQ